MLIVGNHHLLAHAKMFKDVSKYFVCCYFSTCYFGEVEKTEAQVLAYEVSGEISGYTFTYAIYCRSGVCKGFKVTDIGYYDLVG